MKIGVICHHSKNVDMFLSNCLNSDFRYRYMLKVKKSK